MSRKRFLKTMARYKPQDRNSMLLPVVLPEQIVPGSFAFALDYLMVHNIEKLARTRLG